MNGMSDLKLFLEKKKLERAARTTIRDTVIENTVIENNILTQPTDICSATRRPMNGTSQTKPAQQTMGLALPRGLEE